MARVTVKGLELSIRLREYYKLLHLKIFVSYLTIRHNPGGMSQCGVLTTEKKIG